MEKTQTYAAGAQVPADLQARLAKAYMSGNGAEVVRLLAQIAEGNFVLPPKTVHAA